LELRKDLSVWNRILSKEDSSSHDEDECDRDVNRRQPPLYPQQTVPKTLLNSFYKLRNILDPPLPSWFKNNHPPILECLTSMPNIRLWSSLYLDRIQIPYDLSTPSTKLFVNTPPKPHGKSMKISSPRSPNLSSVSPISTTSSSPSPIRQGSVFIYSSNKKADAESRILTCRGHDYLAELNLVESLLEASTISTKVKNSSEELYSPAYSKSGGPSISTTTRMGTSPRRNPFLESS